MAGALAGFESCTGRITASRRCELREFAARLPNGGGPTWCGYKIRKGTAGSSSEILYATRWCGRKWLCPVCGYNASRKQMTRVQRTLRSWRANGGATAFLTLTQSHTPGDSLAVLWERMDAGWAALVRGSGWIADKQTFGLRGYFRATEVVHNPLAGWNVHFHVILLLDVPLDLFHLYVLKDSTSNRFAHGVARKGGYAAATLQDLRPVTPGSEELLAAYCGKGTTARTSKGSRTPMAILDDLERTGEGYELWEEFTKAVSAKRHRHFVASPRVAELVPENPLSC